MNFNITFHAANHIISMLEIISSLDVRYFSFAKVLHLTLHEIIKFHNNGMQIVPQCFSESFFFFRWHLSIERSSELVKHRIDQI